MGGPLSIPMGQPSTDSLDDEDEHASAPAALTLMARKTVSGASPGGSQPKQRHLLLGSGKRKRRSSQAGDADADVDGETVVSTGPASKRVKGGKKGGFSTGAGNPFSKSRSRRRTMSPPRAGGFSLRRSPRRNKAAAAVAAEDVDDDDDAEMESDLGFVQSPSKPLISRTSSTVQKLLPKKDSAGRMITAAMEIKSKSANDRRAR